MLQKLTPTTLTPTTPAGAQVVGDHVPAQVLGFGREHPTAAAPGDRVDEPAQARVLAEHEQVERRAVPGQLVDLDDGRLDRLAQRRPPEDRAVRRRCARSARRRSRPARPARSRGACAGAGRPAGARAAGWCPSRSPARPPASSACDSGAADRPKPMICSASCGNRVAIRCDSASAVCFIGPQRSSSTIETDRSTQSATAADARRSVSTTSKSSTVEPHRHAGTGPQHRPGHRADHVERLRVAVLPRPGRAGHLAGGTGVAQVVLPAPARRSGRRRPVRSAVPPSRRSAFGLSVSPSAVRVTQPCRRSSRSSSCSRRTSSAAARPERARDRLDVDVVERGARDAPGRAGRAGRRGRRSPPARRPPRRSPSGSPPRTCSPPAPAQVGPQRAQVVAERRHLAGRAARRRAPAAIRLGQLLAAAAATASASAARRPRPAGPGCRPARRRSAGFSGK